VIEDACDSDEVFAGIDDDDPPLPHAESIAEASAMPAMDRILEFLVRNARAPFHGAPLAAIDGRHSEEEAS
jgi:hypothetical protein